MENPLPVKGAGLFISIGMTLCLAGGITMCSQPSESSAASGPHPILTIESIRALPADSWHAQGGTKLRNALFKGVNMGDPASIMTAWSGGTVDPVTGDLMVWGGGLGNYKGNEIYRFRMDSLKWVRLTDPCLDFACADPNPCGSPIVRHTYNGVSFLAHANRIFLHGGAYNCEGKGCGMRETWTFDMAARKWQRMSPKGDIPNGGSCGNSSAYDPVSQQVFFSDDAGLYAYKFETDTWKRLDAKGSYYQTAALDYKRGLFIQVGEGAVTAYDIRKAAPTRETWSTKGDQMLVKSGNPGIEYDPYTDRIVGWAGGAVYSLDLEARTWERRSSAGAPAPTDNGIFGRWRYSPAHNVFVSVTGVDQDVHFYKASAGAAPQWVPNSYKTGTGFPKRGGVP